MAGAILTVVSPPFSAFIVALLLTGVGACFSELSLATYTAHFKDGPMMSLFYAASGVGSLITPLIVAAMVDRGIAWHFYYLVPLGTSIISIPLVWLLFRAYIPPEEEEATRSAGKRLLLAVRDPVVLMGGLLAALSLSSADIISSWLVSFMITIRHGNAVTMRYILAGFLGGSQSPWPL